MAIPASGPLDMMDVAAEFGGAPVGAFDLSALYRGNVSGRVRNPAGDGAGGIVNKAAAVPTSGSFDLSTFYGTERAFEYTLAGSGTNRNIATYVWGSDWGVNIEKRLIVTGTQNGLTIPASGVGTIKIKNNGEIQGTSGVAGTGGAGGAGGNAITCASTVLIDNSAGAIRGGGGGGGRGGTGGTGGGGYYYTYPSSGNQHQDSNTFWRRNYSSPGVYTLLTIMWGGSTVLSTSSSPTRTSYATGIYVYYIGSIWTDTGYAEEYYVSRTTQTQNNTSGGGGGAGGAGAAGQGYGVSAGTGSNGSGGSAGGTNAGTGGTGGKGGNGGGWGAAGATGNTGSTGAAGNRTSGSGGSVGSSGGAAGRAISGSGYTVTATGTINGAY